MVGIGGEVRPTAGNNGTNSISGKTHVVFQNFTWEGTRTTAAKATLTSGAFLQITLSGGNVLGYIEYLVSG